MDKKCKNCNETLPKRRYEIIFCSRSCAAKYNNKSKIRHGEKHYCLFCNIRMLSVGKRKKFCNKKCRTSFNDEEGLEKLNNGELNNPKRIKRLMIKMFGDKCMDDKCAWDSTKRKIKVELDHIDGNSNNNSLSNLRLLCPNCHSLTSTYKGKNKGNGRWNRLKRYKNGKSY